MGHRKAPWSPEDTRQEALRRTPRWPRRGPGPSCTVRRRPWGPLRAPPQSRETPESAFLSVARIFHDGSQSGPNQATPRKYVYGGAWGPPRGPEDTQNMCPQSFQARPVMAPKGAQTLSTVNLGLVLCGNSCGAASLKLGCPPPRRQSRALTQISHSALLPLLLLSLIVVIASSPYYSSPWATRGAEMRGRRE